MVTGGFFGVGETVGYSYHLERVKSGRPSNIWHILPTKDSQVLFCQINFNIVTNIQKYITV